MKVSALLQALLSRTVSVRTLLLASVCLALGFSLGRHWQTGADATFGSAPLVAAAPLTPPQSTLAVATDSVHLPAASPSLDRSEVFGALPQGPLAGGNQNVRSYRVPGSDGRDTLVVVIKDSTASL